VRQSGTWPTENRASPKGCCNGESWYVLFITTILFHANCLHIYAHHFYAMPTEQALGRESDQLRNVSQKYENDKKLWTAAISNLERKIKVKTI
jgi:hypothetical protein